jgi:hypothetical protein
MPAVPDHAPRQRPYTRTITQPAAGDAVRAGGVRALVGRDPVKRHDQRRRVVHEVEQVIEPAARIGHRPTVKLGLHPRYPRPRPWGQVTGAAVRRRVLRHCSLLPSRNRCRPSPCDRLSRPRTTTAAPPRPARSAVGAPIPASGPDARRREPRPGGSRVHCDSLDEIGARLCPCGIAAGTPQAFPAASLAACANRRRSSPPVMRGGCAPLPAQIRQVRAGA